MKGSEKVKIPKKPYKSRVSACFVWVFLPLKTFSCDFGHTNCEFSSDLYDLNFHFVKNQKKYPYKPKGKQRFVWVFHVSELLKKEGDVFRVPGACSVPWAYSGKWER
ncbi:MAG: hypothetical protein IJ230_02460 [Clostridia bacterium]|nr:hypothetical protein [Clostridia bacterium]